MIESASQSRPPRWLMPLTEYGPLIAFFIAYVIYDLMVATAVVIGATAIAVIGSLAVTHRIPWLPLITAAVVGVFGGLTLYLADETFIKMKPTIVQVLFAVALLGSLAMGKPLLKLLMGKSLAMSDWAWRTLTWRFGMFFLAMAGLNEAIWRTQSTDFWVSFKVFGILVLTFGFIATQIPFMLRHGEEVSAANDDAGQ